MSTVLRRCMRSPVAVRAIIPRTTAFLPRTYASTTKGDAANATNLATPSPKPSDSPQEGDIKSSRAQSGRAPQESGSSVAQPISEENQTKTGQDEAGGDPAKEMGGDIEKQGNKPLDPADK